VFVELVNVSLFVAMGSILALLAMLQYGQQKEGKLVVRV
jgi:hypothetical protein